LIADVAAVVRATGRPRAHIGGHDWGGVIAWVFASAYSDLTDTLLIFNAPHPAIYAERVWRPPQLFRSWYVLFFLLPRVSERALSAFDFRAVRRIFRTASGRRPAFDAEEIEKYVRALAQPGALTAALNYYRANVASPERAAMQATPIDVETLVLWGERDPALTVGLLDGLDRIATRLHVHRFADAGHWVQNEAPDEVNDAVITFLRSRRVR
jgi:pimeloyl-ACP methyl ester carboxylesterase